MQTAIIDLHVHLDGSIPLRTAGKLLHRLGLHREWDEAALRRNMQAPEDCPDLNAYLSVFDLPLRLMQSREGIEAVSYAFHELLAQQGLLYAEPRFAPSGLTGQGLRQEEALQSALRGRERYYREHPDSVLHSGFLLCAMRGDSRENARENTECFELAAEYLGRGVLGVDLAGAEALYPTERYRELFERAAKLGLPYTIHAGEAAGEESIRAALSFQPQRIGHGIRAAESPELLRELAARQIPLELCPSSNLQTRIFPELSAFPLRMLYGQGVKLTVNTDNMTVSNTSLSRELSLLRIYCGLDLRMERTLLENAVDSIFAGEEERVRLRDAVAALPWERETVFR